MIYKLLFIIIPRILCEIYLYSRMFYYITQQAHFNYAFKGCFAKKQFFYGFFGENWIFLFFWKKIYIYRCSCKGKMMYNYNAIGNLYLLQMNYLVSYVNFVKFQDYLISSS